MSPGPHDNAAPRRDALDRLEALEREFTGMERELRAGLERVRDELFQVRAGIEALPELRATPAPEPPAAVTRATGDAEGARLVALDLVLSGTPRDEAALRLAAEFPGVDAAALLDEAGATSGV